MICISVLWLVSKVVGVLFFFYMSESLKFIITREQMHDRSCSAATQTTCLILFFYFLIQTYVYFKLKQQ